MKEIDELIGEIDLYDFDISIGNCEVSYSIGYNGGIKVMVPKH